MMCGAGLLNGARIFSFEQLLLDYEIYEILKTFAGGVEINDDTLALDVIDKVGPRIHFMLEEHTLANLRRVWQPAIIDRCSYEDWVNKGKPSPADIARERAKEILENHKPLPLENNEKILEIINYYEKIAAKLA